jgi:hypothetical protein
MVEAKPYEQIDRSDCYENSFELHANIPKIELCMESTRSLVALRARFKPSPALKQTLTRMCT